MGNIIVAIANLKGGVGKSTLTVGLAGACMGEGRRTLIVDADDQATLRTWAGRAAEMPKRPAPSVENFGPPKAMARRLLEIRGDWDVILIDLPPKLGAETVAAMAVSDVVLMPVAPSPADVWALQQTLTKLGEAHSYNHRLQALAVWNRVGRTAVGRAIVGQLEDRVGLAKAAVRDRVAHVEAMMAGRTVTDYAPSSDADIDLRKLALEVFARAGAA